MDITDSTPTTNVIKKFLDCCHWGIVTGLVILVIIFIITLFVLPFRVKHKHKYINKEGFDTYIETDDELQYLKDNYQLGKPSGVLDYLSNQVSCDTPYNLLVQPNVTFKPTRRDTGCTFVELRYPG